MNNQTRKEHFVSKFYLKKFADSKNKLNVYDRQENKFISPTINNFAFDIDLYETKLENGEYLLHNDLENHFSEIERDFNTAINKVIDVCNYPQNENSLIFNIKEIDIIKTFIANFLCRNPWTMQQYQVDDVPEEILNNTDIVNINEMLIALGFGNINSFVRLTNKYLLLDERREDSCISKIIKDLSEMNYMILKSNESQFITSSFPVIFSLDENDNLNSVYLPLSPQYAIIFLTHSLSRQFRNRMINISSSEALRINHLYLAADIKQNRFLIANNKSVLKNVIKR